jgi:ABC-type multidrug transport system ATPase subunit
MTARFYLVIVDGPDVGRRLAIDGELELGRDVPGEGQVGDEQLSRRHAVLREAGGALTLADLASSNGTFVNGGRILERTLLEPGDTITVGQTVLEVRVSVSEPQEQVGAPTTLHEGHTRSVLLCAGRRIPVPTSGVTIGRAADCEVVVDSADASRHHARVEYIGGRASVADLGSMNGTYLNGERLTGEARWLHGGDTITVGDASIRFVLEGSIAELQTSSDRLRSSLGERLTIGRDPSNDIVLDAPTISRLHAQVLVEGEGRAVLSDLGSRNGTRVDGIIVAKAELTTGSEVGVGPFRLVFDGVGFHRRDGRGALRMDGHDVSVAMKGKTLLDRASITVQPGELVVVIGESGSGKTTLLRVLVGVTVPTSGVVLVNGDPLEAHLPEIGYLPQDEIVHPRLTVVESLLHSARLRLPADSSRREVEAAVERVLTETTLTEHAGTRIGALSGGQRKRVGLATELLPRPGLLFLDEPTTGLDPGLESRMMELFRGLASVGQHALLVVTHATRNLALADRLYVLGRGGHVCFGGRPQDALEFFDVDTFDNVYLALDRRPPVEWRADFERSVSFEPHPSVIAPAPSPGRRRAASFTSQTGELASRYAKVFSRDRRNVLILTLQTPLIALATALLFKPAVFDPPGRGIASSAAQLLFLLVVTTIWLGTISSAREIIKERAVFEREHAVGIGVGPYLASKLAILAPLMVAQVVILLSIVMALRPLGDGTTIAGLLAALVLTGLAAVSMGLLISAMVRTEEQAMALIPLAMIAQLLFGGALVTIAEMGAVLAVVSSMVFSRWAFATVGSLTDMNARIAGDISFSKISSYGPTFFDLEVGVGMLIMVCFTAVFIGAAALTLSRR